MGLNDTPSADRVHIGFFGIRNAGKSSVVNAVTAQEISVVSDVCGTTTDPVKKAMEILPVGPVLIIDTPGFDDNGTLGELRVKRTKQILNETDVAVLVVDGVKGKQETDLQLINIFKEKKIPYLVVYNKEDLLNNVEKAEDNELYVSARNKTHIYELKEKIGKIAKVNENNKKIVSDLINPLDFIVLVVPIDSAAPKGRLILPQQQTIRDILEKGAIPIVTRESELEHTLNNIGKKPAMVITDSQAFNIVNKITPSDILLTSFSILMARYKGILDTAIDGVLAINNLQEGDTVLISEGCTHHRQCDDIGSVKLPKWLQSFTGKNLNFEFTSGNSFKEDLSKYKLIIHCGGCMLNEREVSNRMKAATKQNVPITNYGIAIAYMNGILKRSLSVFPQKYNMF